jgi:glycosyltransferase involved in cell wall biosynthesis
MKILLTSEKYPPDIGGLAVSVERLARLLHSKGHTVQAIAPSTQLEAGQRAFSEQAGVQVHRFGAQPRVEDGLAEWFDLIVERCRQDRIDILHAYFLPKAGFVTAYAGQYLGLPSVVSARGNDLDRAVFDPGKAAHILYALQQASAITANSRRLVRQAQALAPGRPVVRSPNGVDAAHFQPQPRDTALANQLGLDETPLLAFVGEARAKKGLATLLLAFRQIAAARPAALLLLGGVRPGEDESLLQVFQKQNPELKLVVQPYVPSKDLPAYYSLVDLLLMPSRRDGLPNALLEAMACERAVLASDAGGISDAIRDGENGCLVPPGDAPALVAAALELLDDPSQRRRLGSAARLTVLADFSLEQELQANLTLYARLLKEIHHVSFSA